MASNPLPFFVTLPTPFLITVLLTQQVIDSEFSTDLELSGDKFRDSKNESTTLNFKKQNCNQYFIHPNLVTLSKKSFKNFARDSAVGAKKKIFRPIRVLDVFGTKLVYTMNQHGNIPPHALLQWRSDVNCRPGLTIKMLPLSTPQICLQQYKM